MRKSFRLASLMSVAGVVLLAGPAVAAGHGVTAHTTQAPAAGSTFDPAKFKAADTDGDGRLSREEFLVAADGSGPEAVELFEDADKNKDGYLSEGEAPETGYFE